jgi:hypothetical protein
MRYLFFLILAFLVAISCRAQAWSGNLLPTNGSGSRTVGETTSAATCAVDWSPVSIKEGTYESFSFASPRAVG